MSNRTKHIAVHVTDGEYAAIKTQAEDDGRTISDWSRLRLLGYTQTITKPLTGAAPRHSPTMRKMEAIAKEIIEETPEPSSHPLLDQIAHKPPQREFRPYSKAQQAGRKPKP